MPRRRRRFKRRNRRKKGLMSKVKSAIKKEVGKTRELKKLVSFVMRRPIRSLNTQWVGSPNTPWENTVIYSLTGGRLGDGMTSADTLNTTNTPSALFALRPAFASPTIGKVQLAGQGGVVDSSANVVHAGTAEGGVHTLQGRECYLKNFYCNLRIQNAGHPEFTTVGGDIVESMSPINPISQYIRILVIETRKPLLGMRNGGAYNSLASQILLQLHAGDGLTSVAPAPGSINADAVSGFLNYQVIKKVVYDKIVWLGDGDQGTAKTQFVTRLKIPINRKAYFNSTFDQTALNDEPVLKYQGPWYYMLMFGSNEISQSLDVAPRVNMSSILTLYDD